MQKSLAHAQTGTGALTLGEAWLPRTGMQFAVLRVLLGSVFIALCAQISIPLQPVPLTGQTLGVLLMGAVLGSRLGALAVLAYLGEGLLGLPVFANLNNAWAATSRPGVPYILGTTGGYLAGFVVAAFLVGWLSERGWDRKVWTAALAMVLGNVVIYAFGVAWLARFLPAEAVLSAGMILFLPGDAIKIAIAAAALPGAWALAGRSRSK